MRKPKRMTWAQYAVSHSACFVAVVGDLSWYMWKVYLPNGAEPVVDSLEEARRLAAEYGCSIIL